MRRRALLLGLAAAAAALAAGAARPALPAGNLLQNPGAEAGQSGHDAVVPIPGWTVTGNFTVDGYANGDDLGADVASAIAGGANYFYGGPANDTSSASQVVDVSRAATEIDAGGVPVAVGGDLGGYSTQGDSIQLTAEFLDGSGGSLGQLTVPGPTESERNGVSTLVARSATGTLPAGTRSIRVTLTSTRTDGSDDDGLADNLSLTLASPPSGAGGAGATIGSPTPPPPPRPSVAVDVQSGTGTTLVRLPGAAGFATLRGGDQIPVGSTVDVTRGSVALTSAEGKATFRGGVFTVREPRAAAAARVTVLALAGGSFAACPTKKTRRAASAGALRPTAIVRRLFGSGKGRFRTSGRFAAATVRGTAWEVYDRCDGTYVEVKSGAVAVSDLKLHRTIVVTARHSYLARR